tara:strand:- start:2274 stop:3434 length:1161 start_codon:yes stop_codon:yes gene_type:complete
MNKLNKTQTLTKTLENLYKYKNLLNVDKIKKLGFDTFSRVIRNKSILNDFGKYFSNLFDLENVKESNLLVRKFLTCYIVVCFPDFVFNNEIKDVDDLQLKNLSNKISILFNNILNYTNDDEHKVNSDVKMQEFKIELDNFIIFFDRWKKKDVIKVLLPFANSYYELNDTLALVTKNQQEPVTDDIKIWKSEIEKQKNKILKHVKNIDGDDAVTFVKNYQPPKLIIDDKVYEQIERTMKKAYWDKLKEDIENDDFSMITPLLTDVRTMIFQLIPNRPDLREEFDSKIDLELVKQMITHKAMDVKTVYSIALTLIEYLKTLQAPIDDRDTQEWCDSITNLFYTENISYADILPAFFSGMFQRLEKIKQQLHDFYNPKDENISKNKITK